MKKSVKLYLSSYRIPDPEKFVKFVGRPADEIRFGLILNAKDAKPKAERAMKRDELLDYFRGLGFKVEEIDLRDYKNGSGDLGLKFLEFDVVWLNGGNTYSLRSALAESRAEKPLKEAMKKGVAYGGDSAGAIAAGPTLKHFDNADDPTVVSKPVYEGLGFIDYAILPHCDSEKFGELLKETRRKLFADGFKTIRLNDDEALFVTKELE